MSISPNGYNYTINPKSDNPFWVNDDGGSATFDPSYEYHKLLGSPTTLTDTDKTSYKITFSVDGSEYSVVTLLGLANRNNIIPFYRGDYVDFLYFANNGEFSMTPDGVLTLGDMTGAAFISSIPYAIKGEADIAAAASVDDTTGTPAVTVTKTVTDDVTNFDFAFTGIKGADGTNGTDGVTPKISAAASADSSTGTPQVTVDVSGTTAAPDLSFYFTGIKGEKGETGAQGVKGDKGDTGAQGPQGIQGIQGIQGEAGAAGVTPSISATASVNTDTTSTAARCDVTKSGEDTAPTFDFAFYNITGSGGSGGSGMVGWTKLDISETDIPTTDSSGSLTRAYCTVNNFVRYLVKNNIPFTQIVPAPSNNYYLGQDVTEVSLKTFVNGVANSTIAGAEFGLSANVTFNPIDVLHYQGVMYYLRPNGVRDINGGNVTDMPIYNADGDLLARINLLSAMDVDTNFSDYIIIGSSGYSSSDVNNPAIYRMRGYVTELPSASYISNLQIGDMLELYSTGGIFTFAKFGIVGSSAITNGYVYYR